MKKWNGFWKGLLLGLMVLMAIGCFQTRADAATLKKVNGEWKYYGDDGYVDYSYKGLFPYGKSLWYIRGGTIDYDSITLCKYQGEWYYVRDGKVDTSYSGPFQYKDNTVYNIENGLKVSRMPLSKSYKKLIKYIKENGEESDGDYTLQTIAYGAMALITYHPDEKMFTLSYGDVPDMNYFTSTVVDSSTDELGMAMVMKDQNSNKYCIAMWSDGFDYSEELTYLAEGMKYNDTTQAVVNREVRNAIDYWIYTLNINGFHGEALKITLY